MTFTEELIKYSMDIWVQYLTHPFTTKAVNGTLDKELFKNYIIEDSIYLREYSRVFAAGMYKSTTKQDIRFFYELLSFVEEGEASTRLNYVKELGLNDDWINSIEPRKENKEYIDYMLSVAKNGTPLEILVVILPCILSYGYIFSELVKKSGGINENNPYKDFLDDYTNQEWIQYSLKCENYVNQMANNLKINSDYKEKLCNIFRNSSICELKFWDMANSYR
ncbi:MAG: hypothetical protein ATN31_03995 [Candidatus Epulonipiscioides saccharophilum]|nr:MAG: hypothetical protein ATN31_03995 [Epulopiscium sp. AS2M-Bin001]